MDNESVVSQVQRKIELQAPEDLTYLIANVRRAAAERLNEAFPHVEGNDGEDELRNQIEELVNEYIDKTFTYASPNLSINGLPVPRDAILSTASATGAAPESVYEPFDARKRQRVADLITQEEKLLEDVAALKRSVPGTAATAQAELLNDGLKRDEELLEQQRTRVTTGVDVELGGVGELERQEGVQDRFRRAVEGLGRLKKDMPAVVARMERAKVAGEYVVTNGR